MNVLSLFDGMSCGQIALKNLGINVDNYFASEIDKYAIKVSNDNFPNTIHLGDITEIDFSKLPKIDLLIGGSPCQGFSFAGKQLNFNDPRSKLFFEFIRAKETLRPKYFMLENVKMKKEYQDIITNLIGIEPIEINSALVSAQNRKRLYWTNIPNIKQPEDQKIYLKNIIEDGLTDRTKSFVLDANYFKGGNLKQYFEKHRRQLVFSKDQMCHVGNADIKGNDSVKRVYHPDGKSPTLTTSTGGHRQPKILFNYSSSGRGEKVVEGRFSDAEKAMTLTAAGYSNRSISGVMLEDLKWRKLTVLECKRLQTVPDEYIMNVSDSQAYKMLGNGWTVKVIEHIFKNIDI